MVAFFAFFICIALGAPWWAFVIGFLCFMMDGFLFFMLDEIWDTI
jgi:hypothetical protein